MGTLRYPVWFPVSAPTAERHPKGPIRYLKLAGTVIIVAEMAKLKPTVRRSPTTGDDVPVHDYARADLRIQRRMLLATSIVATVTAIYATITLLQYFALRQQLTDARQSSENAIREARNMQRLDQRAWLNYNKIVSPNVLSDPVLITLNLHNSGKTPAINVKVFLHVLTLPGGNSDIIVSHTQEEPVPSFADDTQDSILPNAWDIVSGSIYDANDRRVVLTSQQIHDIETGRLVLYAHGKVIYQDIFGVAHWFTTCYYWDTDLRDYIGCARGNTSDDRPPPTGVTDNVSEANNRAPQPLMTAASLAIYAAHGYPNRHTQVSATLLSSSGIVVGDAPAAEMTVAADGTFMCRFRLLALIRKSDALYLRLVTTPPPAQMVGSIQWWFEWADGTASSMSFNTSKIPVAPEWPLLHINPIHVGANPMRYERVK